MTSLTSITPYAWGACSPATTIPFRSLLSTILQGTLDMGQFKANGFSPHCVCTVLTGCLNIDGFRKELTLVMHVVCSKIPQDFKNTCWQCHHCSLQTNTVPSPAIIYCEVAARRHTFLLGLFTLTAQSNQEPSLMKRKQLSPHHIWICLLSTVLSGCRHLIKRLNQMLLSEYITSSVSVTRSSLLQ